jgi:hypothetical protein
VIIPNLDELDDMYEDIELVQPSQANQNLKSEIDILSKLEPIPRYKSDKPCTFVPLERTMKKSKKLPREIYLLASKIKLDDEIIVKRKNSEFVRKELDAKKKLFNEATVKLNPIGGI